MTDSPAFQAPLDPEEQPILNKLLVTRDKLLLVKQDKTKYVRSQDVIGYYDQVIEQVGTLNNIRTLKNKREEQNRLDYVLDDCLQLISLFFMTIGRNNEAPAAYSLVSTIKRLLEHLKEARFFAHKDLIGADHRLDKIQESVERGKSHHSPHILLLLEARIQSCRSTLAELKRTLSQLSPELLETHEKLVSILRSLSGCNSRSKVCSVLDLARLDELDNNPTIQFPVGEAHSLRKQLKEIKAQFEGADHKAPDPGEDWRTLDERMDAYATQIKRMSYSETGPVAGRQVVSNLIERCLLWSDIINTRQGKVDERFRDTFEVLLGIRNQLDKLSLTQAWSLRETDLYGYQRKLDRIDESRVNGNFVDATGQPADLYEQRTLLYLIRKSYATIYFMLTSSEPVSEALLPIYNQLTTLRKCLKEVRKAGGVSSPRELYPYSMKLNSIDNMRHDGKFIVNGDIPEGQGSVIELLSECFEMAYDLRTEAEKESEDEREEPEGTNGYHQAEKGAANENGVDDEAEEEEANGVSMEKVASHAATNAGAGEIAPVA